MVPALLLIAVAHGSLHFIEDDHPKALAAARAEHKPLFVDLWATWCHSCLSMQRFVLSDPGMKPVADAVVWSSVETEREPNKPVVEKYPVDAWPTFLIVDPDTEGVLGRFLGSGTVQDMRAFVQDGVRAYREKGKPADPAWAAQREGDAARARGDLKSTAEAYGRAVQLGRADAPLAADDRSDALATLSEMLDVKGRHPEAVAAMQERAQVLEKAASAAPDATLASTFDAHRADTYLYLKEPAKAEKLLAQREK